MLMDDEKNEMFANLLSKLMDEMGGGDVHDRFDPEHSELSPDESELDDGTIPTEGLMITSTKEEPAEDDDGDEEEDSPFTRDIFKKRG